MNFCNFLVFRRVCGDVYITVYNLVSGVGVACSSGPAGGQRGSDGQRASQQCGGRRIRKSESCTEGDCGEPVLPGHSGGSAPGNCTPVHSFTATG